MQTWVTSTHEPESCPGQWGCRDISRGQIKETQTRGGWKMPGRGPGTGTWSARRSAAAVGADPIATVSGVNASVPPPQHASRQLRQPPGQQGERVRSGWAAPVVWPAGETTTAAAQQSSSRFAASLVTRSGPRPTPAGSGSGARCLSARRCNGRGASSRATAESLDRVASHAVRLNLPSSSTTIPINILDVGLAVPSDTPPGNRLQGRGRVVSFWRWRYGSRRGR